MFRYRHVQAKGNRAAVNFRKLSEIGPCGRLEFYPPPHSSSKGGSLIPASNRDSFLILVLIFRSEKEEQVYLRRLRLRLTRRKSRRMSQEIEKQNENEEQKEKP